MRSVWADEAGSAAAEFAVALPAVALVLGLCVSGVAVSAQQVRLQDAAADAARVLGRGESAVVAAAHAGGGITGVQLESWVSGELVCARLSAPAAGPIGATGLRLQATSCALDGGR
jgi:hypothetical protein